MRWTGLVFPLLLILLLSACSAPQAGDQPVTAVSAPPATAAQAAIPQAAASQGASSDPPQAVPAEASPTLAAAAGPSTPIATPTTAGAAASAPTPAPDAWQSLPVIPQVSKASLQIYQRGLELGNNPRAFSKVGDCGSTPAWFLGDFDRGPKYYQLGPYQNLEGVIQQFAGSFNRNSLAAGRGFNTSSVFTVLWADRALCNSGETPLACEYRLNRPAFAFIMLGTNDVYHKDMFEAQMRKIIEFSIQNGVLPILSTKADNMEGDNSINRTIARLAAEYDLPLWNFWLAARSLPDYGLQEDKAHLTWGPNRFDDPQALTRGWTVRNLTALQALDAAWRDVTNTS
ncbi:MAG TPA: hypothetical protein VF498_17895 [Anaerolineales bacterium]